MRLLANAMNYAKDAQVEITRVVAKHGFTGQIPIPDVSTKEKAQRYIGLDPKALHDKKERFLDTVVPQWVKKAKENKRFITQPI